MMYLCKFGHNISTRCSDEMQKSFFFTVGGVFWYGFGWRKVLKMNLQVYQSFEYIQFYLKYQRDLLKIILMWSHDFNSIRNNNSLIISK